MSKFEQTAAAERINLLLKIGSRKETIMRSDAMKTMQTCFGQCDEVPDEVTEVVLSSLKRIPGYTGDCDKRDARAADIAPRMATEGWRFCPCFALLRTGQHELIFGLVHTNRANKLANQEARAIAFAAERESAA